MIPIKTPKIVILTLPPKGIGIESRTTKLLNIY